MSLNKYEVFTNIDTTTFNWSCIVRAQRIWKGINKQTQQCWGVNIIFLDDSNNRLHAFMSTKNAEKLPEEIIEGQIYVLSNFKVKQYLGHETYRPLRCDQHIYFTEHTTLLKDSSPPLQIEQYAFDLFALEEVEKNADNNRFLIDVAGIVGTIPRLVSTTKNNIETKRLMFHITDGRSTVNVTLFNELAEKYENAFETEGTEPVVIIIAAAKIHNYEGKVNLTNFPATTIYVNPNHPCVEEIKNNYKEMTTFDISSDDEQQENQFLSVADIKALGIDFIEKDVMTELTVKRMDEKAAWYYARCAKCNIEVIHQDGRYKCRKCNRVIPHPDKRFRVFTYCSDNTGCIGIIIPDSEVRKMINKTVFDIQAEYTEEPVIEPFPAELKQFQHKVYKFIITISEENIKNGCTVYNASKLDNAIEKSGNFSPQTTMLPTHEDNSSMNETDKCIHPNETPTTANSTNMKLRARKSTSPLAFNVDEALGKRHYKIIKKEKVTLARTL
ncbi:hypothetical protein POM88_015443 [Heracleum sosnowskyi]|uniref:Replication factor A C-terminal domain-containing protein n=1 Tax=Heracleum sosnowskyi TaxID=360622 RepID=A0AAD8INQ3_9APIA|nr:hypothetical protein POM88_015443 [Heracleum sosnowskyi]